MTDLYLHPDDLIYESDNPSRKRRDWRLARFDEMTCRYCIPFWMMEDLKREGVVYERIGDELKRTEI